jgi:COP9 signalosome complex subunit 3
MRAILAGLTRLEPNTEALTPFHCNYLLLCLKSINFKAGLTLLKNTISEIDTNKTGVEPKDMLLYYYYGGMVYIGVKDFQKAEYFFDVVSKLNKNIVPYRTILCIKCHHGGGI